MNEAEGQVHFVSDRKSASNFIHEEEKLFI